SSVSVDWPENGFRQSLAISSQHYDSPESLFASIHDERDAAAVGVDCNELLGVAVHRQARRIACLCIHSKEVGVLREHPFDDPVFLRVHDCHWSDCQDRNRGPSTVPEHGLLLETPTDVRLARTARPESGDIRAFLPLAGSSQAGCGQGDENATSWRWENVC